MSTWSMKQLAAKMRGLDIAMSSTHTSHGHIASRPMSNNADVDWDGDNWFFTHGDTRKVRQLEADDRVTLDFQGGGTWLTLRGRAVLHRDKALFKEHWAKDIDAWFEDGIDTPGLTLIQVSAEEAELYGRAGEGIVRMK